MGSTSGHDDTDAAAKARHDGTAKLISSAHSMSPPPSPDDLPSNVCTQEQLDLLPQECLSGNPDRPLRHVDEMGEVTHYALQPMFYSVIFILLVELLERFSFYGIDYTQTSYLTGVYNEHWNAGMSSVTASSYVSVSTAIAYTTPFFGAYLADSLIGDYWSIILGSSVYLPGILLIAATTVPHLLGQHFNSNALRFALLFLWPVGTGIVKSVVNVFGAKQYHPFLQSLLLEQYFVNFYMVCSFPVVVIRSFFFSCLSLTRVLFILVCIGFVDCVDFHGFE
jgi:dipeptide/tripeptide permease